MFFHQLASFHSGTFSFIGANSNSFSGTGNAEAKFNDVSKALSIDTNGDGSADMEIALPEVALNNMDDTDFIVS